VQDLKLTAKKFIGLLGELKLPANVLAQLSKYIESSSAAQLADLLSTTVDASTAEKLQVLNSFDIKTRITTTLNLVKKQLSVLAVATKIHSTVEGKLNKTQREIHLRQQVFLPILSPIHLFTSFLTPLSFSLW